MARTRLTPKEFLQECFPPRLLCLISEDAQEVCQKNNLDFIQLIRPFCRPTNDLISSDLTNRRFYMKNFYLYVCSLEQASPCNPNITRNLFNDHVTQCVEDFDPHHSPQIDIALSDSTSVAVPATTPWYEVFRDDYIRFFPPYDYECIRDLLGCLFVVSTSIADPVGRAKALIEQQVQLQANQKNPRWLGPNILKYFVVLDDLSTSSPDTKVRGESALHYFTTTYGETNCCLLGINSGTGRNIDEAPFNPWENSMTYSTPSNDDMDSAAVAETLPEVNGANEAEGMDHPLAITPHRTVTNGPDAEKKRVGMLLSQEDGRRIETFITDLVNKCLVPYAERQIKILNELIISKKGIHRTLVNATKKIFGPSGPPRPGAASSRSSTSSSSSSTNVSQVVYMTEAVEMHNRKAGDLSFILQLYDQALGFYQSARRDYSSDQAWNYYAAASEMCGLCVFLSPATAFSTVNAKAFPLQFFEAAIKSYSEYGPTKQQASQSLSVRSTFFATEVCKALGLFDEAAAFFKTHTEEFDLLYGLFLEQAGHCYLKSSPRKFSFQMIFAGYRYFKAAQKKLGILAYKQALKVFEGRQWSIAEDHIRMNIVRHSMLLRSYQEALPHFAFLLTGVRRQVASQQLLILKDFLTCRRSIQSSPDERVINLDIPLIKVQKIRTITAPANDSFLVESVDEEWLALEEKAVEAKGHAHPHFRHQQFVFSDKTDNRHSPMISAGEVLTVEIPLQNPLGLPVTVKAPRLTFQPGNLEETLVVEAVDDVTLAAEEETVLRFRLTVKETGMLKINGIEYVVYIQGENDTEEGPLCINARKSFEITGRRLNVSKADKAGIVYAPDRRLDIIVTEPRGKVVGNWENFPRGVLSGQVVRLGLTIDNQGGRSVDHLTILSSLPHVLIFFNAPKDGDILTLPLPNGSLEPRKKVSLSAVFVAPSAAGSYTIKCLLYFRSTPDGDKAPKYGIWRIQHDFQVLPGITLKGAIQPSLSPYQKEPENLITLQAAHVNEVQLQNISIKLIELLSTTPHWTISNLDETLPPDQKGTLISNGSLSYGEEAFLALLARQRYLVEGDSTTLSAFTIGPELDATDHNFIKAARTIAAFANEDGGRREQQDAIRLRLLWKVTLVTDGKTSNVFGIRSIALPIFTRSREGVEQTVVRSPPGGDNADGADQVRTVPDIAEILTKVPDDPFVSSIRLQSLTAAAGVDGATTQEAQYGVDIISWSVHLPEVEPSVNDEGFCVVSLTMELSCRLRTTHDSFEVSVDLRSGSRCFPVGARRHQVVLRPAESCPLAFQYCFTTAGTYNMAEFVLVKAMPVRQLQPSTVKLQRPANNQMLMRIL